LIDTDFRVLRLAVIDENDVNVSNRVSSRAREFSRFLNQGNVQLIAFHILRDQPRRLKIRSMTRSGLITGIPMSIMK
jgi:hypothetical protein